MAITPNDVLDALAATGPTAAHRIAVEEELVQRHRGVTNAQALKAIDDAITSGAVSIHRVHALSALSQR